MNEKQFVIKFLEINQYITGGFLTKHGLGSSSLAYNALKFDSVKSAQKYIDKNIDTSETRYEIVICPMPKKTTSDDFYIQKFGAGYRVQYSCANTLKSYVGNLMNVEGVYKVDNPKQCDLDELERMVRLYDKLNK